MFRNADSSGVPCKKCRPRFEELTQALDTSHETASRVIKEHKQAFEDLKKELADERKLHEAELTETKEKLAAEHAKKLDQNSKVWAKERQMLTEQIEERDDEIAKQGDGADILRKQFKLQIREMQDKQFDTVEDLKDAIAQLEADAKRRESKWRFDDGVKDAKIRKELQRRDEEKTALEQDLELKKKRIDYLVVHLQQVDAELVEQRRKHEAKLAEIYAQWYRAEYGHQKAMALDDPSALVYLRGASVNERLEVQLNQLKKAGGVGRDSLLGPSGDSTTASEVGEASGSASASVGHSANSTGELPVGISKPAVVPGGEPGSWLRMSSGSGPPGGGPLALPPGLLASFRLQGLGAGDKRSRSGGLSKAKSVPSVGSFLLDTRKGRRLKTLLN